VTEPGPSAFAVAAGRSGVLFPPPQAATRPPANTITPIRCMRLDMQPIIRPRGTETQAAMARQVLNRLHLLNLLNPLHLLNHD
jgi:hypothetical protein